MRKLKCVELAMSHPDKLNEEGKIDLGRSIVDEMFHEELENFLNEWGYTRKEIPLKEEDNPENE